MDILAHPLDILAGILGLLESMLNLTVSPLHVEARVKQEKFKWLNCVAFPWGQVHGVQQRAKDVTQQSYDISLQSCAVNVAVGSTSRSLRKLGNSITLNVKTVNQPITVLFPKIARIEIRAYKTHIFACLFPFFLYSFCPTYSATVDRSIARRIVQTSFLNE